MRNIEKLSAQFIEAATVPRDAHASGTLDQAQEMLASHPEIAASTIYTAAIVGDEAAVRLRLADDRDEATRKGGPLEWDALTYLCFSRYLRLDRSRSEAFVNTARTLLDAGADANTGWYETIDHPKPRQIFESAIYGAAGIAQHPALTRLLLERGADPNDEETPYHVPETRDNTVLEILLSARCFNARSLACLLVRKADWHDINGLRLVLDAGGDPNFMTHWCRTPLQQAIQRDNSLDTVALLLDRGADATLPNAHDRKTSIQLAAWRGRGDVLHLLKQRGVTLALSGVDRLIAACAMDDKQEIDALLADPLLVGDLTREGGTLLAQFAGVGNLRGVRNLLDAGVLVDALYSAGDAYFDIARNSTALHVATWRGHPEVVKELITRGGRVNATDGKGRTPLQLAVKACVDSYWTNRRTPDSVRALLDAGATTAGIDLPTGYERIDVLLENARRRA